MEEDIPLDEDGMVVLRFLHLGLDLLEGCLDLCFFGRILGHVALSEFRSSRQGFGEGFDHGGIVEGVMVPGVGIVHDVFLSIFGGIGVVLPYAKGNDANHDDEVCHEYHVAIVRVDEPGRETDGYFEGLLSVGVPEFFKVFFGGGIGECLVCLGHHHELCFCRRVVWVFIGMPQETHFFVCLFDDFELGSGGNIQNGEWIKGVDFPAGLDGGGEVGKESRHEDGDDEIDPES